MLPLGSIVYLKDGSQKLMIVSRGVIAADDSNQPIRYDYIACKYPLGLDVNQLIYFNRDNVDKVLFTRVIQMKMKNVSKIYIKNGKKTKVLKFLKVLLRSVE